MKPNTSFLSTLPGVSRIAIAAVPTRTFRNSRSARLLATGLALLCSLFSITKPVFAQGVEGISARTRNPSTEFKGFYLKSHPGWSVGLEPYVGLAVLANSDETRGHGIAGGVSRVRIGYVEVGAGLQLSDVAIERWRELGIFVGAYLPVVNWVDIDTSIGLAQRAYMSSDTRYGPGGFDVRGASLTYRLGFSERVLDETFGIRLGGALLVSADLSREEVPWAYYQTARDVVYGSTRLGGVSIGLAACMGFDVAFRRSR